MADPDEQPTDIVTPIQPTGFGVADLEIAREQDALAEEEAAAGEAASSIDEDPDRR